MCSFFRLIWRDKQISLKGSQMGHSVNVSLWRVALLINTRIRFFFFKF